MSKADPAIAEVFFALGDETRLALVRRLGSGPLTATMLAKRAPVTRQAVIKHLRVLEGAGLLQRRKAGRDVLYALEPRRLAEARAYLDAAAAAWDRALDRLRRLVEEPPHRKRSV